MSELASDPPVAAWAGVVAGSLPVGLMAGMPVWLMASFWTVTGGIAGALAMVAHRREEQVADEAFAAAPALVAVPSTPRPAVVSQRVELGRAA